MAGANGKAPASGAGDVFRSIQSEQRQQARRPVPQSASDLLGPGFAPFAVKVVDWNSALAVRQGLFFSEADADNAPVAKTLYGHTVAIEAGEGIQVVRTFDLAQPVVWSRSFHSPIDGLVEFGSWSQSAGGGGGVSQEWVEAQIVAAKARANHTGTQPASTIGDFLATVRSVRLDEMGKPTAALDVNAQRVTNVSSPTGTNDAATKGYVDTALTGLTLPTSKITGFDAAVVAKRLNQFAAPNGPVAMGGQRLTALAPPQQSSDAVTKAYVDQAVSPGANILLNPGFESVDANGYPSSWGWFWATGGPHTIQTTTSAPHGGDRAAQIIFAAVGAQSADQASFPVTPGQVVHVKAWVRKDVAGTARLNITATEGTSANIYPFGPDITAQYGNGAPTISAAVGAWQEFTYSFTVANSTSTHAYVRIEVLADSAGMIASLDDALVGFSTSNYSNDGHRLTDVGAPQMYTDAATFWASAIEVRKAANISIAANANTTFAFDTTSYRYGPHLELSGNYVRNKSDVPIVVHYDAEVMFAPNGTGYRQITVERAANTASTWNMMNASRQPGSTTGNTKVTASGIMYLGPGHIIRVNALHTSTVAIDLSGSYWSRLAVHALGSFIVGVE